MFFTFLMPFILVPAIFLGVTLLYPIVGRFISKRLRGSISSNESRLNNIRLGRESLRNLDGTDLLDSSREDEEYHLFREGVYVRGKLGVLRAVNGLNTVILWVSRLFATIMLSYGFVLVVALIGASVASIYVSTILTTQCRITDVDGGSDSNSDGKGDSSGDVSSDSLGFGEFSDKAKSWAKDFEGFTFIGDSLGVGVQSKLSSYFPKSNFNSKVSRMFTNPDASLSGIDTLSSMDDIKSVLVIALGTNQPPTNELMDKMVEASKGKAKKIIWINTASEGGSGGFNKIDHDGIAETIKSYVSGKSNMAYLDWNRYVKEKLKWSDITSDSIHMNDSGYDTYAKFITQGLYDYLGSGGKAKGASNYGYNGIDNLYELGVTVSAEEYAKYKDSSGIQTSIHGSDATGFKGKVKGTPDSKNISDPVLRKSADWLLSKTGKGIGYPWTGSTIDASKRLGPDFYDCSGFISSGLAEGAEEFKPFVGATTIGFIQASDALGQSGKLFKSVKLEDAPAGAIIVSGGLNGAGVNGHIWMLLDDYSPSARVVESHYENNPPQNGGPMANRTESDIEAIVGHDLVALLPTGSTAKKGDKSTDGDKGDSSDDESTVMDCGTSSKGDTSSTVDKKEDSKNGGAEDGTGEVPSDATAWGYKPEDLPASLRPYIIDPASYGMKYGGPDGWVEHNGQCVALTESLADKIWGNSGVVIGNGWQQASAWSGIFGNSVKSKPKKGAIFSTDAGNNHTGIVCHVFKDSSILVAEQNTPLSGATYGMVDTWDFRIIHPDEQSSKGFVYAYPDGKSMK